MAENDNKTTNITEQFKNSVRANRDANVASIKDNYAQLTAGVCVDIHDSLKIYLHQISVYGVLTREEEYELGVKKQNGDEEARQTLINCNLRLAVSFAKDYLNTGCNFMDLIGDANSGLSTAVDKWDVYTGNRLSTVAYQYMRLAIQRGSLMNVSKFHIPSHIQEKTNLVRRIIADYKMDYSTDPTAEDILEIYNGLKNDDLKLTIDEIKEILELMGRRCDSIDDTYGDERDATSLSEVIADPDSVDEAKASLDIEERDRYLSEALLKIDKLEAQVIILYFGLFGAEQLNCEEIARKLHISAKRVRGAKERGMKKLGELLEDYNKSSK